MPIILGIDPGLQHTGWGVVAANGNHLSFIACGAIHPDTKKPMAERLCELNEGIKKIVGLYKPQEAAVEETFVNANARAALALGQARGTAICAAVLANLPVAEYTALQVKQSVVGNGHARKEQVQDMVRRLLALPGNPSPDAADALACAICHAHAAKLGSLSTRGLRLRRGRLG